MRRSLESGRRQMVAGLRRPMVRQPPALFRWRPRQRSAAILGLSWGLASRLRRREVVEARPRRLRLESGPPVADHDVGREASCQSVARRRAIVVFVRRSSANRKQREPRTPRDHGRAVRRRRDAHDADPGKRDRGGLQTSVGGSVQRHGRARLRGDSAASASAGKRRSPVARDVPVFCGRGRPAFVARGPAGGHFCVRQRHRARQRQVGARGDDFVDAGPVQDLHRDV